jgi:hypothetical protein
LAAGAVGEVSPDFFCPTRALQTDDGRVIISTLEEFVLQTISFRCKEAIVGRDTAPLIYRIFKGFM